LQPASTLNSLAQYASAVVLKSHNTPILAQS
jgi:hypothetical protein